MIQKIEEGMYSLTLTGSALKRQNHGESVNLRVTRRRRSKRKRKNNVQIHPHTCVYMASYKKECRKEYI